MLFERNAERLKQRRDGAVLCVTECQTHGELSLNIQAQFSGQRNVTVRGIIKLPVHLKVIRKVGPAVTSANVAARCTGKVNRAAERQPYSFLLRYQDFPACNLDHRTVVIRSAYLKMWCAQHIKAQL